jgi:hypothetical protein
MQSAAKELTGAKGTGFSPYIDRFFNSCFVSGHDFSRAISAAKPTRALERFSNWYSLTHYIEGNFFLRKKLLSLLTSVYSYWRTVLAPDKSISGIFAASCSVRFRPLFAAAMLAVPLLHAQTVPVFQAGPIAIVPIDTKDPDVAAKVTGALEVSAGKAIIAVSGAVTSGSQTTQVMLPHRGVLRICASTTVKLTADTSVPAGETPGLMMAMDHGAIEASFATGRNSDILLTPDFRILIGGPGAADVKVRLGPHGDTCVDNGASSSASNAGANVPYVLVTSVFDGGDYRVKAGQRVMFEHGSLREVVDQEKEPCGCPPPPKGGNEFPLAQSEGLAPLPKPAPGVPNQNSAATQSIEPLVYKGAAQPAAAPPPASAAVTPPANPSAPNKKPGFFSSVGRFFRRIFGAE